MLAFSRRAASPVYRHHFSRSWLFAPQTIAKAFFTTVRPPIDEHRHPPPHHHAAGVRARKTLAQEWLRTHGFRLAPVNPLRRDGLMTPIDDVVASVPPTLRPLVQPLIHSRLHDDDVDGEAMRQCLKGTDQEQVLISLLQRYSSTIGYEIMQCATDEERQFFIAAAEREEVPLDDSLRLWCLEQVARSNAWERLLSRRYPTCRRFSLEGLESGVVALQTILDTFAVSNEEFSPSVIMGTLHRGRINLRHTVLQQSVVSLLREWDGTEGPTYDDINLGHSVDIQTRSGRPLHVSLVAMPAHLESQDAAVAGKARGHMMTRLLSSTPQALPLEMDERIARSVLPLVVHGDSSFCGEGIVSETLQLSTYAGFDCGGTVHVIFNNQVGFTGETQQMRTSRHRLVGVSDLALGIRAPILHVNADRPLDVYRAARLATLYRQKFGKDVVLDLWGYRRHGHNEVDEPRITNVSLYQAVDSHEPTAQIFLSTFPDSLHQNAHDLCERIEAEYSQQIKRGAGEQHRGEQAQKSATTSRVQHPTRATLAGEWLDFWAHPSSVDGVTSVGKTELQEALSTLSKIPDGFTLHKSTLRAVSRRAELLDMLNENNDLSLPVVDWATAELLALSTLANEGHFCRLSGQDSQRGTFSQRHGVWHDTVTGELFRAVHPLVQILDSPVSELGVMGFEHGMSLASPNFLILWEAQFADFSNNSQVLIDTMLSSEKEKFGLESNLVLLLPHGYDGMGPEHSSARLERFLTLHTDTPEAAEKMDTDLEQLKNSNYTVVYPSDPSNYFHVLRRSFSWPFRRPMVVLTPKRTLRMPRSSSPLAEFLRSSGSRECFCPVLDDPRVLNRSQVKSIAVCSGELFYDVLNLVEESPKNVSKTVAILRLEQLAPFPMRQFRSAMAQYPCAQRAVWMQEEPGNMGALRFTQPFLERLVPKLSPPISRPVSAAPAVGNPHDHQASQAALLSRVADWIKQ